MGWVMSKGDTETRVSKLLSYCHLALKSARLPSLGIVRIGI